MPKFNSYHDVRSFFIKKGYEGMTFRLGLGISPCYMVATRGYPYGICEGEFLPDWRNSFILKFEGYHKHSHPTNAEVVVLKIPFTPKNIREMLEFYRVLLLKDSISIETYSMPIETYSMQNEFCGKYFELKKGTELLSPKKALFSFMRKCNILEGVKGSHISYLKKYALKYSWFSNFSPKKFFNGYFTRNSKKFEGKAKIIPNNFPLYQSILPRTLRGKRKRAYLGLVNELNSIYVVEKF